MTTLNDIARGIARAHEGGEKPASNAWPLHTADDAYAVQDLVLARLGWDIGGWKVGARDRQAEPHCAPIAQELLLSSGSAIASAHPLLEVEVALRLRVDVAGADAPTPSEWPHCVDAVLVAMEWVDSRLAEGQDAGRLAKLADWQSLGALVVGAPVAPPAAPVDLGAVRAWLRADDVLLADARGSHPVGDMWRLLGWLAVHCAGRGAPLRAGQIVTTGSCVGLVPAASPARVTGGVEGIGEVVTQLALGPSRASVLHKPTSRPSKEPT